MPRAVRFREPCSPPSPKEGASKEKPVSFPALPPGRASACWLAVCFLGLSLPLNSLPRELRQTPKSPRPCFFYGVSSFPRFYLSPAGNVRAAGNPRRFVASTALITSRLAAPSSREHGEMAARLTGGRPRAGAPRPSVAPGSGGAVSFRRRGDFRRLSSRVPRTCTRRPGKSFRADKNEKDGWLLIWGSI